MLGILAQVDYNTYTTTELTTNQAAGLAAFSLVTVLIGLAVAAIVIVSMWKIFTKAGEQGWKSIIPIYNYWTLCEIVGKPGWWALSFLVAWIPFVGWIIPFIVSIIVSIELAKAFGKDTVFAILLILLPIIGYPILAFSDAKYKAPPSSPAPTASA